MEDHDLSFFCRIHNLYWTWMVNVHWSTIWQLSLADCWMKRAEWKLHHCYIESKNYILEQKPRMLVDAPLPTPTDVVPLVNNNWSASFSRIDKYKKVITKEGWGPCTINLLLYKDIENITTCNDHTTSK